MRSPVAVCFTYFNPRTPVGCDSGTQGREATRSCGFQSTHPSGVRLGQVPLAGLLGRFQSTHPSGVRLGKNNGLPIDSGISIHAPQWGATISLCQLHYCIHYFNPRTPVGCDVGIWRALYRVETFQSTHPSGVRPAPYMTRRNGIDFNPRTPVGCDRSVLRREYRTG